MEVLKPEMNPLYSFWNYLSASIIKTRQPLRLAFVSEEEQKKRFGITVFRGVFFAQPVTKPGNVLFVPQFAAEKGTEECCHSES